MASHIDDKLTKNYGAPIEVEDTGRVTFAHVFKAEDKDIADRIVKFLERNNQGMMGTNIADVVTPKVEPSEPQVHYIKLVNPGKVNIDELEANQKFIKEAMAEVAGREQNRELAAQRHQEMLVTKTRNLGHELEVLGEKPSYANTLTVTLTKEPLADTKRSQAIVDSLNDKNNGGVPGLAKINKDGLIEVDGSKIEKLHPTQTKAVLDSIKEGRTQERNVAEHLTNNVNALAYTLGGSKEVKVEGKARIISGLDLEIAQLAAKALNDMPKGPDRPVIARQGIRQQQAEVIQGPDGKVSLKVNFPQELTAEKVATVGLVAVDARKDKARETEQAARAAQEKIDQGVKKFESIGAKAVDGKVAVGPFDTLEGAKMVNKALGGGANAPFIAEGEGKDKGKWVVEVQKTTMDVGTRDAVNEAIKGARSMESNRRNVLEGHAKALAQALGEYTEKTVEKNGKTVTEKEGLAERVGDSAHVFKLSAPFNDRDKAEEVAKILNAGIKDGDAWVVENKGKFEVRFNAAELATDKADAFKSLGTQTNKVGKIDLEVRNKIEIIRETDGSAPAKTSSRAPEIKDAVPVPPSPKVDAPPVVPPVVPPVTVEPKAGTNIIPELKTLPPITPPITKGPTSEVHPTPDTKGLDTKPPTVQKPELVPEKKAPVETQADKDAKQETENVKTLGSRFKDMVDKVKSADPATTNDALKANKDSLTKSVSVPLDKTYQWCQNTNFDYSCGGSKERFYIDSDIAGSKVNMKLGAGDAVVMTTDQLKGNKTVALDLDKDSKFGVTVLKDSKVDMKYDAEKKTVTFEITDPGQKPKTLTLTGVTDPKAVMVSQLDRETGTRTRAQTVETIDQTQKELNTAKTVAERKQLMQDFLKEADGLNKTAGDFTGKEMDAAVKAIKGNEDLKKKLGLDGADDATIKKAVEAERKVLTEVGMSGAKIASPAASVAPAATATAGAGAKTVQAP